MTAMRWFYSFLKKHNKSMALGLVLVTVISVLAIVKPIVSGSIVDDVITAGDYSLLPGLIALLILITILRGVLRYWSQVIFETARRMCCTRCGIQSTASSCRRILISITKSGLGTC